jgi:hypothetical protein
VLLRRICSYIVDTLKNNATWLWLHSDLQHKFYWSWFICWKAIHSFGTQKSDAVGLLRHCESSSASALYDAIPTAARQARLS